MLINKLAAQFEESTTNSPAEGIEEAMVTIESTNNELVTTDQSQESAESGV